MATTPKSPSQITTPKVRFSYVSVFEAKAMTDGKGNATGKPKFSVSLIIPKSDTAGVAAIRAAIKYAEDKFIKEKLGGIRPVNFKMPLRDGDAERPTHPEYANAWFLNASSDKRPKVVDAALNAILDSTEFYSGCYGKAAVNFYGFNTSGNKGIACGLNNLQKLADGEALGGGSRPEDDFDAEDDLTG